MKKKPIFIFSGALEIIEDKYPRVFQTATEDPLALQKQLHSLAARSYGVENPTLEELISVISHVENDTTMKTWKLFDGSLAVSRSSHPILSYLAVLDEEMLEFRLKQMARQIMWGGDMLVIANTAENELATIGANDNLQIARDWLGGKEVF